MSFKKCKSGFLFLKFSCKSLKLFVWILFLVAVFIPSHAIRRLLQSFFSMRLPLFLSPFMATSHPDSVGVPCTFQLLNPCHSHRGIPNCGFWLVIICLAFKLNLSMSASDNVVSTSAVLLLLLNHWYFFELFIELCFLSIHPIRLCKHESRVIVTKCSIHCSQSLQLGLFFTHWTLGPAHFSMGNAFPHKPAFESAENKSAEWSLAVKFCCNLWCVLQ